MLLGLALSFNLALALGGPDTDVFYGSIRTSDGGLLLLGSGSFGRDSTDALVVKLDSAGAVEWQMAYGATDSREVAVGAAELDDGYLVVGNLQRMDPKVQEATNHVLLLSIGKDGSLNWARKYGDVGWTEAMDAVGLPDGSVVVVGWTGDMGAVAYDIFVAKIGTSGAVDWAKIYGDKGWDKGFGVALAQNGDILVTGTAEDPALSWQLVVMSLSPDGRPRWIREFGTPEGEGGMGVCQLQDGGVGLVGWSGELGDPERGLVAALGPQGALRWAALLGDSGWSVFSDAEPWDGGLLAAGWCAPSGERADAVVLSVSESGAPTHALRYQVAEGVAAIMSLASLAGEAVGVGIAPLNFGDGLVVSVDSAGASPAMFPYTTSLSPAHLSPGRPKALRDCSPKAISCELRARPVMLNRTKLATGG